MSTTDNLPLIIILDLDGTIIGDITPQVLLYELIKILKRNISIKFNIEEFKYKLMNGIVRPYFKKCLKELSKHNIEFFVYTASEKVWAEFVIKNIEESLDISINRPIFTRKDCKFVNNDYLKSTNFIKKKIVKSLSKKKNFKYSIEDFNNRILIIDNRDVFDKIDKNKLIICDTYNYKKEENIFSYINRELYEKYNKLIYILLKKHGYNLKYTTNYEDMLIQFYSIYINELKKDNINDLLFYKLMKIIIKKNIKKFSDNKIDYIRKKLNKKDNNDTFF